jgi:hypothetical protein
MTTEITIFEIPDKELTTNKSQKELEYEELERISKLPSHHFNSFYDIELLNEQMRSPDSSIVAILCKYVVQYCMPVITDDDMHSKIYNIALQNEHSISVYNDSLKRYQVIPADIQFNVVGVRIPTVFTRKYNKHILASRDHLTNETIANSGQYGLMDLQTKKFTQQRYGFTHPGLPNMSSTDNIIYFNNETTTKKTLGEIIEYITFMETYYNTNLLTLYIDMKIMPYVPTFLNDGRKLWKIIRDGYSKKLIDAILPTIDGKIGDSFEYDVLMTLEQNNLIYAYNMGKSIGIDTPLFQREINGRQNYLTDQTNFVKQRYAGYVKKLEISKKQSIAFNKYNETNLDNLDKKQQDVVLLEYNKLEKFLSKTLNTEAKQNQVLYYRLRKSFQDLTDDRLRDALNAIKKEISMSQLNGKKLIDGGVCPHVFTYGETLLKNFNKPWLNTELRKNVVNQYSLPTDISGYFCYICGEHLADADREGVVRFIGGERVSMNMADDPLQTMIWKEAMYIISTYVKFNTPIPIKPLVNSIAQGLRNIIGEQEVKLFKSRTKNVDSIKDTLNLYACIYIYAVLCAMMLNNPNKMLFGRDRPDKSNKYNARPDKSNKYNARPDKSNDNNLSTDSLPISGKSKYVAANNDNSNNTTNLSKKVGISEFIEPAVKKPSDKSRTGAKEDHERKRRASRHKRRSHRKKSKLRKYVGGKTTTDIKLYERYILTTALNLIILTKDSIIKRLSFVSTDVVKQIFLKNAYPWTKKYSKPIKVVHDGYRQVSETQSIIDLDPFYKYLYYAQRISRQPNADQQYPSRLDDVPNVLGRSMEKVIEDLKMDIGIYDTVVIPKKWDFGDTLYDDYTYDSFILSLKYNTQKIFQKTFVPRHVQVIQYYEDNKLMLKKEKEIVTRFAKEKLRPIFEIERLNDILKYNDFRPEKLDLAQHYCPSGEQHTTGKYIYSTDTNKDMELEAKEIVSWILKNDTEKIDKFSDMKLINERCSKCDKLVRTATSNQRSDKSLVGMFEKIDDVLAFYQYYDTRCPKGDLHNIVNNKCNKCGLNTLFRQNSNSADADAYYNKYIGGFKKVEHEKQSQSIMSLQLANDDIEKSKKIAMNQTKTIIPEYKFTLQKIAEWSQVANVKYNILVNIGLSEGFKYDDIKKARINPSKKDENTTHNIYQTHALKLKNYILQILRLYNMIMNHENNINLPSELKEILTLQKKVTLANLDKSMPQFIGEFIKLDDKYRYTLSSCNYVNFLMEYLAKIIVDISKKSSDKYKTMSTMLVKYFTKLITSQEKTFSKAESVFAKRQMDITTAENDSADEGLVSGDEYAGYQTDISRDEFSDLDKVETYKNEIGNLDDAFDVENVDDIWDND